MCLSKAFIEGTEGRKVLCDRVKTMSSENGKVILKDLFGDAWEVEGTVGEVNFTDNYIVMKNVKSVRSL